MCCKLSKKYFIISLIALIFICMFAGCSCDNEKDSIKNLCLKYASEYTVVNEDDGKYCVSVSAPDFQKVAKIITEDKNDATVDTRELIDVAEQHPNYKKEYKFYVDECTDDNIQTSFLEQVSYDLAMAAIKNIEYSERWDTE